MEQNKTIASEYDSQKNFFDIFRLLLAVAVIFSHCYPLLGKTTGDPLAVLSKGQTDIGSLAVDCFFVISGFLITQSMYNSKSAASYLVKRALRIFPAFFVSLIVVAFFAGPLLSQLSMGNYIATMENGPFLFVIKNLTMNIGGYAWGIHDVFASNPFAGSVNGSMWTLKHEMMCYLLVLLCFYLGFYRHRALLLTGTGILGVACILSIYFSVAPASFEYLQGKIAVFNLGEYCSFVRLGFFFFSGACYYSFRDRIPLYQRWIVAAGIVIVIGTQSRILVVLLMALLPYFVIGLSALVKRISVHKLGDLSYGMYIYAFPIQQTLVYVKEGNWSVSALFWVTTTITGIFAFISWHIIESPALKLKKYVS